MTSNELIHRYLLGIATEDDVRELETRLIHDDQLQDEFLFQAEVDAHLRQELHSAVQPVEKTIQAVPHSSSAVWKWVSGISTLAAAILLALFILNIPTQQAAMAYPSLGKLNVDVSRAEHNIWAAAADGDLKAIGVKLENRVSVNAKAECGLVPLHVATLFNRLAAVELLLSSGADVSLTDAEGNTALHMAAFLGHTDIVRVLLKAGADPDRRNALGFSAIDNVAVRWSSGLEAYYHNVEKVLKTSLDLKLIRAERPKILKLLSAANPEATEGAPTISIWQAAMTGNTAAVERHISAGTDLDQGEEFGGSTSLTLAAIFGQNDVAKILIDAGADLEIRNNSGGTALHSACFFCRPEIVELLLHAGADPNNLNNRKLTPLDVVTIDFDAELEGAYRHVYDSLDMEFDPQYVRQTRIQIADILREHLAARQ